MKWSGCHASARENQPGSTRRASATTSAASPAQSRKPPSNMKLVGSPPGVPALTQNTPSARAATGASDVQGPARPRAGLRARGGEEGNGRARHQVEEPGVGPVVDPRRIGPRVEQHGHEDRRQDSQGDGQDHTGPPPAHAAPACSRSRAPRATPGRTAPRSPATTCAATAKARRTGRSRTGACRWSASCSRRAGWRWRHPAGPRGR